MICNFWNNKCRDIVESIPINNQINVMPMEGFGFVIGGYCTVSFMLIAQIAPDKCTYLVNSYMLYTV